MAEAGGEPAVLAGPAAPEAPESAAAPPSDPQVEAILTILDGLPARVREEVLRRLGEQLPPGVQQGRKAS